MPSSYSPLLDLLIHHIQRSKGRVLLTLLLVALAKVCALSAPFALKFIVDSVTSTSPQSQVAVIVIGLVVGYVLALFAASFFDELKSVVSETTVQPLIAHVGQRVFSRLIALPHDTLIQRSFGETVKNIDRALRSLQSLVALSIHTILPLVVELVILIGFTFAYYDIYFAILLGAGLVLHGCVTILATKRLAKLRENLNTHDTSLTGQFIEAINNLETIKIFQSEKYETRRFTKQFHAYAREAVRYQTTYSKVRLLQQAVIAGVLLVLLLKAGWGLLEGQLSPGDFVLINAMAMQVLVPISFVGTVWKDFLQFLVDVKVLSSFLTLDQQHSRNIDVNTSHREFGLQLKNVNYAYSSGKMVVKNISLNVPPRSFIAIVGPSGSGKSTILKLMAGLIKPSNGKILINGIDASYARDEFISQAMAMVSQNVVLFHGSIADNIKYSNRKASKNELVAASEAAQLHDRVLKFAEGYDTQVGERGLRLSGGERQLLGLARAFLKRPKILLLDEPSSALDAKTEADLIEKSLLNSKDLTRVVVTHRLASVKNADKIFMIADGSIVEEGSHTELMALGGAYARLWNSQGSTTSPTDQV